MKKFIAGLFLGCCCSYRKFANSQALLSLMVKTLLLYWRDYY